MKAVGIDLGTTNSAVATYDPDTGRATILVNGSGRNWTPSVVGIRKRDNKVFVGEDAVGKAAMQPKDTVVSVKRLMGRVFDDPAVTEACRRLSYEIAPGPGDDPRAHVMLHGRPRTPVEISGLILERLAQDASRTLGEAVTHAVITVPAYFGDAERAATREAAERAGLVVKKIIDEPTAAAVAFGVDKAAGEDRRVLVYDLGGGTFDISILNMTRDDEGHGQFQVLVFTGDRWLGGNDFDDVIVDRITRWVQDEYHLDPSGDSKFLLVAREWAEKAKRVLNNAEEADISIPGAYRSKDGVDVDVEMTLTREEFHAGIEPLVARTMRLVEAALTAQALTPADLTDVLLVGGGTLTARVYETVERYFGRDKVRRNLNPMECVALGAGVLAGTLHGVECPDCRKVNEESAENCSCGTDLANARAVGDTALHESTARDMGIEAVREAQRDAFVPIIPRGTPYPLPKPETRSFRATDRRRVRVPVYEGNSPVASKNEQQGVIEYELPEEIDIDQRIDVSFNYSRDRIITVRISVPGTGMQKEEQLGLRPDRRAVLPPVAQQPREPDSQDHRELLNRVLQEARQFLGRNDPYIELRQKEKVDRDINEAERVLIDGSHQDYERLADLLWDDMYHHCGLASQFENAALAADGAPAEIAEKLNATVEQVKQVFHDGNTELAEQLANNLRSLVAAALSMRRTPSVRGMPDFEGMLRDETGPVGS